LVKIFRKKDRSTKRTSKIDQINETGNLTNASKLGKNLETNITDFKQFVGSSPDINIRLLQLSIDTGLDSAVIYIDGLCDKEAINEAVIKGLVQYNQVSDVTDKKQTLDLLTLISQKIITNVKVEQFEDWTEALDDLFSGDTILLVDGLNKAIVIGTRKWADRGIQEATTEQVIRGSKDSFSETLYKNTMLLRRRIKSHKLHFYYIKIGSLTKSDILIAYIDGVVNPKLVEEVKERLGRIETDAVLSTSTIEEFIEDSPFAALPQMIDTERPDKSAAHLLEGGVAILIDGTPFVLLLPITFWQFLYSPEDYYSRIFDTFLFRSLRVISLLIALSLPSFYVAIASFHQEMIPIGLLEIIISGRKNIPFPILTEVLIMEFILEVIREAGVRLPRNVGQAISIVGALVLGQAAIQAKLASPATVTIVALAAIANFTMPSFSAALSIRVLRFGLLIVSSMFGIFGFLIVLYLFILHLCSLRSFGVPFMAPFAPAIPADFKDSQIRMPVWMMSRRPKFMGTKDEVRQKADLKPGTKQKKGRSNGEKDND
jgi:spore germination protein KA